LVIGVIDAKLVIRGSRSLKDKRSVLRSLKEKLRNEWNVSVAEVDLLNRRQSVVLGIVQVGGETKYVRSCLDKIVDAIRSFRGADLIDYTVQMHHV